MFLKIFLKYCLIIILYIIMAFRWEYHKSNVLKAYNWVWINIVLYKGIWMRRWIFTFLSDMLSIFPKRWKEYTYTCVSVCLPIYAQSVPLKLHLEPYVSVWIYASMQICISLKCHEEMTTGWVQLEFFLCIYNCLGKIF